VGKISPSAAAQVARMLGLSYIPSAFQIRYVGCKGMVVADPTCVKTLNLRDSMRKFDSAHQDLEIVGWSSFSPR
jgi:RNA-dependent RNA polymerase